MKIVDQNQAMLRKPTKINKDKIHVVVSIDGRPSVEGFLFVTPGDRIIDLLNDDREFLPLELLSGESVIVRKSEIQMVEPRSEHYMNEPIFTGTSREIFQIDEYTSRESLKRTYEDIIRQLHPKVIADAGLHPALVACAQMLKERLDTSYDEAEGELVRDKMKTDRLHRVNAAMEAEKKRHSTAHKSA